MRRSSPRKTSAELYFRGHQSVVDDSIVKLGDELAAVGKVLVKVLQTRRKVLAFGNGGSATQASHFAGELMGRFSKAPRQPLAAVALPSDSGVLTCIGNDFGYGALFERQIAALVQPGDVAVGFTTSGSSENVLRGLAMARKKRAITVALTGSAGLVGDRVDHMLAIPSSTTSYIQEVHLMFVHLWCTYLDEVFVHSGS
jgi:D-sedoheptulose 7-phosphate isomerase